MGASCPTLCTGRSLCLGDGTPWVGPLTLLRRGVQLRPLGVVLSLFCFGLVACQAPDPLTDVPHTGLAGRTDYIVDGVLAENYESVVLVINARSGGICTGAIIADRVVLTAKHCIQNPGASAPQPPSAIRIGVGTQLLR